MSVSQVVQALGAWSLKLRAETPGAVTDALSADSGYFGHVAISTGRMDPRAVGDALLGAARYVGVLRAVTLADDAHTISGNGLAYWLGDEGEKAWTNFATAVTLSAASPAAAVAALLPAPAPVTVGTIYSIPGSPTYTGAFQWQTPRTALGTLGTHLGGSTTPVEYRVNGDFSVDFGPVSSLYRTTPLAAIVRRYSGRDMGVVALPGTASLAEDVIDFTTHVDLLGQGSGAAIALGTADISPGLNPYKDPKGNSLQLRRMVNAPSTSTLDANSLAAASLATYTAPKDALTLSTAEFDIAGTLTVGDYVWVHDPDAGLIDTSRELRLRGEILNPTLLRCTELDWPVAEGMSVAFRATDGTWLDLTDYVEWETGDTTVVVGAVSRQLIAQSGAPGDRAQPDTSVPAAPAFSGFTTGSYQSPSDGSTKALIQASWSTPANTDGSTVTDGDHYEIRYRTSAGPNYPSTWQQVSAYRWSQLTGQRWSQPIAFPVGPWQYLSVPWGTNTATALELTPGISYDFSIRAVDSSSPPNPSAWSSTTATIASVDVLPPSTPAAPSVAASMIAVQVTHTLGKASGGTYNLEPDLHHLEVHYSYDPAFTPSDSTLLGKLTANAGTLVGDIPAVGTFQIADTTAVTVKVIAVDISGNKSLPSSGAQVTAALIDDEHISNLTVSKLLAGTINADMIMGASIATGTSGERVVFDSTGIHAYDATGALTFDLNDTTSIVQLGASGGATIRAEGFSGSAAMRYDMPSGAYAVMPSQDFFGADGYSIQVQDTGGNLQSGVSYASDGTITTIGKFPNYVNDGPTEALITGSFTVTGSSNNITLSYGPTLSSIAYPMVTGYLFAGGATACSIAAQSTTSFKAVFGSTSQWDLHFWVFRSS